MSTGEVMALYKQLWRREARRTWQRWRASGLLLMGGYLALCGLALLVAAWQSLRVPVAPPDPALAAALACAWWSSAWLAGAWPGGRPTFGLTPADEVLLRTPTPPREVLLGPLLRRLWRPLGLGLVGASFLWLWWPNWGAVALALPLLVTGRLLLQGAAHDGPLVRDRHLPKAALEPTLLVVLLPLLGLAHPLGLALGAAAGVALLSRQWWERWRDRLPPAALRRWQVEGTRQAGQKLGLELPDWGPDGAPSPRWLRLPLPGQGAWTVALWRSALHLLRRRRWLLLSLVMMPLLGTCLSVLAAPPETLDPLFLRSVPLLFGQAWAPLLRLLGPELPAGLPLAAPLARLTRALPAGLWLGVGAGVGAGLWGAGAGTLLAAGLTPLAALLLLGWLGHASPGGPVSPASLRLTAAALPLLLILICGGALGGWLAPLVLLAVGLVGIR